jgi:hypothetical protein
MARYARMAARLRGLGRWLFEREYSSLTGLIWLVVGVVLQIIAVFLTDG